MSGGGGGGGGGISGGGARDGRAPDGRGESGGGESSSGGGESGGGGARDGRAPDGDGGSGGGESGGGGGGGGGISGGAAPATDRKIVFRTRGLTKSYDMGDVKVHALRGVDLDLYAGEMVVLLGASGSGKSTLVNILGGLDTATEGQVFYHDQDLTRADDKALTEYRRHWVGFVFQFYNLIPSLTARENVAIVTEIADDPMDPDEALEIAGLRNRGDSFPAQLSGGEQQRVAIARAIAKKPAVLLCDEPTGALDSKTGIVVLEALDRVNRELGTTTFIITHNEVQAEMAERVIYLRDGEIANIRTNERRKAPHELSW